MSKGQATVTIDIQANVAQALTQVRALQGAFAQLGKNPVSTSLVKDIASLENSLTSIATKAREPFKNVKELDSFQKDIKAAEDAIKAMQDRLNSITSDKLKLETFDPAAVKTLNDGEKAIKSCETALKNLAKAHIEVKNAQNQVASAQDEVNKQETNVKNATKSYETKKQKAEEYAKALTELETKYQEMKKAEDAYEKSKTEANPEGNLKLKNKYDIAREQASTALGVVSAAGGKKFTDIDKYEENRGSLTATGSTLEANVAKDKAALEAAQAELEQLKIKLQTTKDELTQIMEQAKNQDLAQLTETLKKLGIPTDNLTTIEQARQALEDFGKSRLDNVNQQISDTNNTLNEYRRTLDEAREASEKERAELQLNDTQMNQTKSIANRISYMASFAAMMQTVTKVLRESYQTIKELDAAMAETAVVTSYSIDDMWTTLDGYTKAANELGVAIKDVYQSSTLYYQQGLKTAEVNQLTNSTLKMARIAGLDAADATDRMTNALRGFNMALNETNAENVADVYSKLAAMSASNVDEISTAMTKVASLANSANMSFENTAAFLSQIIETTRESAETAGTALKTVVARFAEVKNTPDATVDVEGEAASYNKIDKALRTVGISLDAFMKGQEGLDSVLMKLAKKWDTLSTSTQRYIATQAAGSRQQSRFIALMSDYARTQELVNAANNASGASASQYAKTLDTLETKLNQLSNAWDTFTTQLLDQSIIKDGISLLTGLLNILNDFNNGLDELGNGGVGVVARLAEGFIALKGTSVVLNSVARGLYGASKAAQHGQGIFTAFFTGMGRGVKTTTLFGKAWTAAMTAAKASTPGATSAVGAFFTTLWSGLWPILAIMGALAALILIIKKIKAMSLDGQIEATSSRLSEANDELQNANDNLDSLNDSFATLNEEKNELAQLSKGTAEWCQKVLELNQAVQQLAESYGLLNMVKYDSDGIAYLDQEAQDAITKKAQDRVLQAQQRQNLTQDNLNELNEQKQAKTSYNSLSSAEKKEVGGSYAGLMSLARELVNNPTMDISGYSADVQNAAVDLANTMNANQATQNANTQALMSLNNSFKDYTKEGQNETIYAQEATAAYNQALETAWTDAQANMYFDESTGTYTEFESDVAKLAENLFEEFDYQSGKLSGKKRGIKSTRDGNYEIYNTKGDKIGTYSYEELVKMNAGQNFNNDTVAQEEIVNTALQKQQTYAAQIGNNRGTVDYNQWQAFAESFSAELNNLDLGNIESISANSISKDIFKQLANNSALSQYNGWSDIQTAGLNANVALSNLSGITLDEETSDTIWQAIYQGMIAGGESNNFDFSGLGVVALDAITKGLDSVNPEAAKAAGEALTKLTNDIEAQNKTYNNASAYETDFMQAGTEDQQTQNTYYEDAAKQIYNLSNAFNTLNLEVEDAQNLTNQYGLQLKRIGQYGKDFSSAVSDYSDALKNNDMVAQSTALNKLGSSLRGLTGLKITSDMLLDPSIKSQLATAMDSVENLSKLLDSLYKQTIQNSTIIGQEAKDALVALGSGYQQLAGTIFSAENSDAVRILNEQVENSKLSLTELKALVGDSYTLKVTTDIDGTVTKVLGLVATGNDALKQQITSNASSKSKWTNPLERHYQLLKDINKEQRTLNKLQHEYELATKIASGYTGDTLELLKKQKAEYQQQYALQSKLKNSYQSDLEQLNKKYAQYSDYMHYDFTKGTLVVNEAAWQKLDNTTQGTKTDTLDKMKELFEAAVEGIEGAEDSLMEIESEVASQRSEAYTSYWDLVSQTIDMIVEKEQEQIDIEMAQLDAQEEANSQLITTIRDNFNQLRQDRENEKTEKNISDLTKKLAYLRQDTTGGNATQIKELEKQLAEQKESYTDTLIDQGLDAMEKSYEATAEYQRSMIDFKQKQLDYSKDNNAYQAEAQRILQEFEKSGCDIANSEWGQLFTTTNKSLTTGEMYQKTTDVQTAINNIKTWLPEILNPENTNKNPDELGSALGDILQTTNENDGLQIVTTGGNGNGNTEVKKVQQWLIDTYGEGTVGKSGADGSWGKDSTAGAKKVLGDLAPTGSYKEAKAAMDKYNAKRAEIDKKAAVVNQYQAQIDAIDKQIAQYETQAKNNKTGTTAHFKAIDQIEVLKLEKKKIQNEMLPYQNDIDMLEEDFYQLFGARYATGGLADFTGPAWLDGTKSNPELVLNAKDTENFIQLKDILRSLLNGTTNNNTTMGDSYFDIDVNVEKIESDYDINKIADDIKYSIYKDASYRNINTISTLK